MYPWSSWRTLVPLILCAVGFVVFIVHQEKFAAEPLIRTSVFKNRTTAVNYFGTVIHGIVLWSLLYFGPLYYEGVKEMTPIMSAVSLFPQTFTVAPAAMVVGTVVAITGRFRWSLYIGWALTTLGMGVLVYMKVETSTVAWVFMNLVSGLGTGMLFPSSAIAIQAAVKGEEQGYAVTIYSFLRGFGQTLGVVIGGVIFQNEMKKKLLTFPTLAPLASEYSKDASGLVQIMKQMPASPEKQLLKEAYTFALTRVWLVMCIIAAVAFAASFATEKLSIDVDLATEQGFMHDERNIDEEKQSPPN